MIPLTTVVIGHPAEQPPLTDRLPLDAVVHYDRYKDYTDAEIDELWAEKEASPRPPRCWRKTDCIIWRRSSRATAIAARTT